LLNVLGLARSIGFQARDKEFYIESKSTGLCTQNRRQSPRKGLAAQLLYQGSRQTPTKRFHCNKEGYAAGKLRPKGTVQGGEREAILTAIDEAIVVRLESLVSIALLGKINGCDTFRATGGIVAEKDILDRTDCLVEKILYFCHKLCPPSAQLVHKP
jgi:hypothetical protein